MLAITHLLRANMSSAVRFNVRLDGAHNGEPGVTAVVMRSPGDMGWCLLADHPHNPGASVTNAVREYAEAVCGRHECSLDELHWFELDSMGFVDQVWFDGAETCFAPLNVSDVPLRSQLALVKVLAQLGFMLGKEELGALDACFAPFRGEKQNPQPS